MNDRRQATPDHATDCDSALADEKRARERVSVTTDLLVTPLDDEMNPLRSSFRGRTKDLSTSGVSFIHATPFNSKFVLLSLSMPSGDHVELLFHVVRSSKAEGSRYFTAGEFVKRLDRVGQARAE